MKKNVIHALLSLGIGLLLCLILMLIWSALVSGGSAPEGVLATGVGSSCLLGALVTGWMFERRIQSRALVFGALTGVTFFLLLFLLGMIFYGRVLPLVGGLTVFFCSVIGGVLGGVLGNRKKKRRELRK